MRQSAKIVVCLLLLLALCACGSYESRVAGTWMGDGSLDTGVEGPDGKPPFNGAELWTFDGEETAVATVNGRHITFHYYASDDTLTLNDGGETSWGIVYERRGDTLRLGNASYTRAR